MRKLAFFVLVTLEGRREAHHFLVGKVQLPLFFIAESLEVTLVNASTVLQPEIVVQSFGELAFEILAMTVGRTVLGIIAGVRPLRILKAVEAESLVHESSRIDLMSWLRVKSLVCIASLPSSEYSNPLFHMTIPMSRAIIWKAFWTSSGKGAPSSSFKRIMFLVSPGDEIENNLDDNLKKTPDSDSDTQPCERNDQEGFQVKKYYTTKGDAVEGERRIICFQGDSFRPQRGQEEQT